MKRRLLTFGVMIASAITVGFAQEQDKVVVLSQRIGAAVDLEERDRFQLFPAIQNFSSAIFYLETDGTFRIVIRRQGNKRDTVISVPGHTLRLYVERIEHWEELQQGRYALGSSLPRIIFEDGTPIDSTLFAAPHSLPAKRREDRDAIPLSPNTYGLTRPMFPTIHLYVSLGVMWGDFSGVSTLTGSDQNFFVPLSFFLHIPFTEDPDISFIGGFGGALGGVSDGDLLAFSALLVYRPTIVISNIRPLIGFGVGHSSFEYFDGVVVDAEQSYPMIVLGSRIIENYMDVFFVLPFARTMEATFEGQRYTIRPAGPGLMLLWSF